MTYSCTAYKHYACIKTFSFSKWTILFGVIESMTKGNAIGMRCGICDVESEHIINTLGKGYPWGYGFQTDCTCSLLFGVFVGFLSSLSICLYKGKMYIC